MTGIPRKPLPETLDGQLLRYWEREALRLEALAARASFGWLARGLARKARRAREQAERSRAKEVARGRIPAAGTARAGGDSPG